MFAKRPSASLVKTFFILLQQLFKISELKVSKLYYILFL